MKRYFQRSEGRENKFIFPAPPPDLVVESHFEPREPIVLIKLVGNADASAGVVGDAGMVCVGIVVEFQAPAGHEFYETFQ